MDSRIKFVEQVFDFVFNGGFREQLASRGNPEDDLNIWHLNAQAFARITIGHDLTEVEKLQLLTLIESARFETMAASGVGVSPDFDFSGYDFPATFVEAWSGKIIQEVVAQSAGA